MTTKFHRVQAFGAMPRALSEPSGRWRRSAPVPFAPGSRQERRWAHPPERSPDPLSTFATVCGTHFPPRAVPMPRPFSAAAICRSVFAPAAWASRMAGATLSAKASAPAEWFALAIAIRDPELDLARPQLKAQSRHALSTANLGYRPKKRPVSGAAWATSNSELMITVGTFFLFMLVLSASRNAGS